MATDPITKTNKAAPSGKMKVFIQIDAMNNFPTAAGSINGKEYSFQRGQTVTVPVEIAEHMIACGQAISV